jgi:hypothetical protein
MIQERGGWLTLTIVLISVAPTSVSTTIGTQKYPPLSPLRPEEKGLPYPLRVRDGITEEWRDGAFRETKQTYNTPEVRGNTQANSNFKDGPRSAYPQQIRKPNLEASVPQTNKKTSLAGMSLADIRQKYPVASKPNATPQRPTEVKHGMEKPASPTHALLADAAAKARAVPLHHRKFRTHTH